MLLKLHKLTSARICSILTYPLECSCSLKYGWFINNQQCSQKVHAGISLESSSTLHRFVHNGPFTYTFLHKTKIRSFFTQAPNYADHSHKSKRSCWKCGADTSPEKELFFCECGVVQSPAKESTFFDLLKIKQDFDVDVNKLSQKFKATQKKLHPDMFSNKSKEEQEFAAEQSSLLNKSYSTLNKSLSRAIYLLKLGGVSITEKDSMTDPEFLMDMMEDFEKIENATCPNDITSLEKTNGVRIDKCVQNLSKAFQEDDLVKAKELTIQLRYFTTIEERIKELHAKSFG